MSFSFRLRGLLLLLLLEETLNDNSIARLRSETEEDTHTRNKIYLQICERSDLSIDS